MPRLDHDYCENCDTPLDEDDPDRSCGRCLAENQVRKQLAHIDLRALPAGAHLVERVLAQGGPLELAGLAELLAVIASR